MEKIKYTKEDCMDLLSRLGDASIDLAIVDPPYGIKETDRIKGRSGKVKQKSGKSLYVSIPHSIKNWDDSPPPKEYFDELFRVSKRQIIFGGQHFSLPKSKGWIVWDKYTTGNFGDCEMIWTSFLGRNVMFRYMWNGMMQGKSLQSPVEQNGNKALNEKRIHPTQKPVKFYRWILENFALAGDVILDTHAGSGSSLIACLELGFDFIACENDEEYFELSSKRIEAFMRQTRLW